ncbi:hypothetical protein [Ereboglobus luteus]|uniref:Uncharacterized protein n=1 Tax=Ereboglobus luteus TaxID=1796921 RepID=A0A2U8E6J7_9BACT|nr:hypothetical protein [Ereboglobus luteus]AWI10497.1 hypothetical protein CKA38_03765 [Ereboglobus luteus]
MSLFTATFLPGLFLIVIGVPLLVGNSLIATSLKAMPRSPLAAAVFWGAAAVWFLYVVWHLSPADLVLFETPKPWVAFFGAVAVAAFYFVPDFLAIRGLSALTLLAAWEVLMGLFGEYDYSRRLFAVGFVYAAIVLAIYFGCVPYRARDIIQWLFVRVQRARALGAFLVAYGLLVAGIAFSY